MSGAFAPLTGPSIEILDRSEFLSALELNLEIDPSRTAVVTVEMTRRRLPADAPFPPGVRNDLVASTEELLTLARQSDMKVIHVLSALRPVEASVRAATKFSAALASAGASPSPHGPLPDETVEGQDGTFKPDLIVSVAPTDFITKTKKSMSAFHQTDVEWLLKAVDCDTVVLAGTHTNADIYSTAMDASCKGLTVITVPTCVATSYGQDLHDLGLQQLARCQGFLVPLDVLADKVSSS